MVKLRLRRMGSTNKPFYRLIATDVRSGTQGRFLETLGWYDPKQEGVNFKLKTERIDYWLSVGAQVSDTAKSLIKKARKEETVGAE
ncbi:30S ribosomal protein S16 [Verrucomicrobiota bacterium]